MQHILIHEQQKRSIAVDSNATHPRYQGNTTAAAPATGVPRSSYDLQFSEVTALKYTLNHIMCVTPLHSGET